MTKSNQKYNLKYLYRATYNDGTVYDQNVDDISVSDKTKSCYNDLKLDQLHYFTLSNGMHSYTLDLVDGGFSVNGSDKIYMNETPIHNIKLMHFRRVTLAITGETRAYTTNFILGYEALDSDNKPITRKIILK